MLSIKGLTKIYQGTTKAVDDVTIDIQDGEFVAFIGTSGSGKTTALRMLNRMIEPTSGTITIDGKDVSKMNPVELRRSIGYVLQQIGLLPHMTIKENIVLVPKLLKWPEEKKDQKARELLKLVDLPESYLDRYPSELSGGQQQRIGVVRALAAEQNIILMDEPFGALDPITRDTLQDLVKELQQKLNKTFIFVTHDMDEAIKLADKICIMSGGKVLQFDTLEIKSNMHLSGGSKSIVEHFKGQEEMGLSHISINLHPNNDRPAIEVLHQFIEEVAIHF
ncbi:osmoprotectant transport system ATP-binding protein [Lacicoccus qingdaonensis]|uniref:Carnitine transport ATP-binding protein OpuCA n=1 Tax=Lacicoccus qingdaonensis TaxID=576118 RepID=A0A1G9FWC5_9BACL|nr:osmoprotectant transport system ATP-binding protein [Salinicoccus qingdaonensis]